MAPSPSPYSSPYARSPGSTTYGRSPSNTPTSRNYDTSPARNRFGNYHTRNTVDQTYTAIDPTCAKEKLPRPPLGSLLPEVLYSTETEKEATSPSRTPTRRGDDDKAIKEKSAGHEFLWTTVDSVIVRPPEVAANLPIPLAAVCTPFADTADCTTLPLSDVGAEEPLRCPRCRCYANPFFKWAARVQRFTCNMCGHSLEPPEQFLKEMALVGHTADEDNHPELVFGSMDFTAPASYDVDRPTGTNLPAACIVIETTAEAVSSGFTAASLRAIQRLIELREGGMQRPLGIVTFDESVNFFTLTKSGRFHSVAMTDLDDPYLPVGPLACFVDATDAFERDAVCNLLTQLQEEMRPEKGAESSFAAGGAALRAAVEAVTQMGGGDVLMFQASSPNVGIGALGPERSSVAGAGTSPTATPASQALSGRSTSGPLGCAMPTPKAAPPADLAAGGGRTPAGAGSRTPAGGRTPGSALNFGGASPGGVSTASTAKGGADYFGAGPPNAPPPQQAAFYEDAYRKCIHAGVAVSCVTAPAAWEGGTMDVGALQWLPWRTGGETLHFPSFAPAEGRNLELSMKHWAEKMQGSAYSCVVKLRCSKGLLCKNLIAPWVAAVGSQDQSAFEIPRLPPDASFAFKLQPELEAVEEYDDMYPRRDTGRRQLYLQVAVLYTNTRGERLLRVHTAAVNIVSSVRVVFQSVSIAPLIALLLKQVAVVALGGKSGSSSKPVPAKDVLMDFCLQVLATYHRHCYSTDASKKQLVISKRLSLLPLFVLAARKLMFLIQSGTWDHVHAEECLRRIIRMPVHDVLAALYPRVYALPADVSEEADLPMELPPMKEGLTSGSSPAYLITNGFGAWFWQREGGTDAGASGEGDEAAGEAVPCEELRANAEALCQRLQASWTPCSSSLHLAELPRLSRDSNGLVTPTKTPPPKDGSRPMVSFGMNDEPTWPDKVLLSALFVEDAGVTDTAYGEWLNYLQVQVLRMSE